jgi:tetratricopeptide (TPR) repeat protein
LSAGSSSGSNNMSDLSQKINEALMLHKNGKFEEAINAYENVLPLLAKGKLTSNLHSNVGALYLQSGDYEKARDQFNNAIEALSEMSGFKSRKTMYNTFNKYHNMTPSEFINKL